MKRGPKRRRPGGCPGCAERDKIIRELQKEIAELRQRVAQLEEKLGMNSQNSSIPPSKDPLDAPPRPKKKKSDRRRGGQPGHDGAHRELIPQDEVDDLVKHVPERCEHCRAALPKKPSPGTPPPTRHQQYELVESPYTVTEHQAHARICECCGKVTRAEIPATAESSFGTRLTALVVLLTGAMKTSRRGAQEFVEEALGIPISLGAVSNLEAEVSESLAESHCEAAQAVSEAERKNVDETGWKQAGERRWLWMAATSLVAFFVIHQSRGKAGFRALLGRIHGILTSDRWHVYAAVKNRCRQVCWAHLARDFTKLAEKSGEPGRIGQEALGLIASVFWLWKDFKQGVIDRSTLQQCLRPVKSEFRKILERGASLGLEKVTLFCENLLALEPALWNFAKHEGLEPTNNHAERVLRTAVIWRKCSFGSNSERGCRYVERMLTVTQTCRLQKTSIYTFLIETIEAHRSGTQVPSLLRPAA